MGFIHHYLSPLGGITVTSEGEALTGLRFDGGKYSVRDPDKEQDKEYEEKALPVFAETDRWLDVYFGGKDPGFTPPLSVRTTEFRKAVLEIILSIPYGKTMTYGEIAERVAGQRGLARMSAQAAGGAAGHNPILLIIPCHRVVAKDGSLTGYAGGIDRKAKLLALEKADIPALSVPGRGHT